MHLKLNNAGFFSLCLHAIFCLALGNAAISRASASQTIVVGGDTGRTIASGMAQLHPGDTLDIEPGVYHETLEIPCDNVTIESTAPGVIIDGSVALTQNDFTPAVGRPGVYTWQLPSGSDSSIPWIFDKGQPFAFRNKPLDPSKQTWSFFVDQTTKSLEVVFDGKGFPAGDTIVVPVLNTLVQAWGYKNVTIRGLEVFRAAGCGIACGLNGIAEDNLVMWSGVQGIVGRDKTIMRRNTIKECNGPGVILYGNQIDVENNLIVACGLCLSNMAWYGTETKANAQSYCTFQQNWLVDRPLGGLMKVDGHVAMNDGKPVVNKWVLNTGLWPDVDCFHNDYIDNCIARLSHAGVYIEYNADRNTIAANDIQDCAMGITIREGSENLVTRNWVWDHECLGWGAVNREAFAGFGPGYYDNGKPVTSIYAYEGRQNDPGAHRIVDAEGSATWGRQMDDGLCLWHTYAQMSPPSRDNVMSGNLVQVSGVSVSVPLADHQWPSASERSRLPRNTTLSNQLSGNYYTIPAKKSAFALLGQTLVGSLAEYQKLTSWDGNATVGKFTPAVLGLEPIWTIPSAAENTTTPVSILHDPTMETLSLDSSDEPLFWHGSAVHSDWDGAPGTQYRRDPKLAHSGNRCLEVTNTAKADAVPLWWTSSSIPVKPGITMGVNFWVSADHVQGANKSDGVRADLRFTDATGHLVGETSVIGDIVHSELFTGTYKYTNVTGKALVPKNACWMTVYLGADPSSGAVHFDDIHINMLDPVPPH